MGKGHPSKLVKSWAPWSTGSKNVGHPLPTPNSNCNLAVPMATRNQTASYLRAATCILEQIDPLGPRSPVTGGPPHHGK